ncbi:hypothetical protein YC2023_100987 [Brassica napus]
MTTTCASAFVHHIFLLLFSLSSHLTDPTTSSSIRAAQIPKSWPLRRLQSGVQRKLQRHRCHP